jgi:uridine phosphorylase
MEIAHHLEKSEPIAKNREFHSYRGYYKELEVGVLSTGVGSPGAAVCAEEAIRAGSRILLRVGTAGSLQEDVVDGDLVITQGAVRRDGTSAQLLPKDYPALADLDVVGALWQVTQGGQRRVHRGVVVTSDAFYGGVVDLGLDALAQAGALCVEMECAAIFSVAMLRRAQAAAILAIDGDARKASDGAYNPHRRVVKEAISREIEYALEAIHHLARI